MGSSYEQILERAEGIGGEGGFLRLILLPGQIGPHVEADHKQQAQEKKP